MYDYIVEKQLKESIFNKLKNQGIFVKNATLEKPRPINCKDFLNSWPEGIKDWLLEEELSYLSNIPNFNYFLALCATDESVNNLNCKYCGAIRNTIKLYGLSYTCKSKACFGKHISEVKQNFSKEKKQAIVKKRQNYYEEHYGPGITNCLQVPEIRKKLEDTMEKRTGYRHALQNPKSLEKSRNTIYEHTGYYNAFQIPEVREKALSNCWSEETRQKKIEKCRQEHGTDYYCQTEEFKEKAIKSKIDNIKKENINITDEEALYIHYKLSYKKGNIVRINRYRESHNDYTTSDEEVLKLYFKERADKAHQTYKNEHNGIINLQDPESNIKKLYYYDRCYFDSKAELVYYIYSKDHGVDIKRLNTVSIPYIGDDNKEHEYFPDFIIDDKYVEVKCIKAIGDNYFINLKDGSYNYAKFSLVKELNIPIISDKFIYDNYLEYLISTYGNGTNAGLEKYLNQFLNKEKIIRPRKSKNRKVYYITNGVENKHIKVEDYDEFIKNNPDYFLGAVTNGKVVKYNRY